MSVVEARLDGEEFICSIINIVFLSFQDATHEVLSGSSTYALPTDYLPLATPQPPHWSQYISSYPAPSLVISGSGYGRSRSRGGKKEEEEGWLERRCSGRQHVASRSCILHAVLSCCRSSHGRTCTYYLGLK